MRIVPLLALLLAGCTAFDADAGMDLGEFDASVRGALTLDIHGTAVSTLRLDADPAVFSVGLGRRGVDYAGFITFTAEGADRAVGTYAVGPEAGQMRAVYDVDTRTDQEFVATDGTLTVDAIRENDLTGSFAFMAADADGAAVEVRGTFRAARRTSPWSAHARPD